MLDCVRALLSHIQLLATPWTIAYQAPPSMGFSRQEYWSGVPLPSPRKYPSFILLQVVDQFSQHHLLKRLSFLHSIFLPPLSKIRRPQVHGFISVQFFCVFSPPLLNLFCFCQVLAISVLYWAHLCMKCPLVSLILFKRSLVFSILLFSSASLL